MYIVQSNYQSTVKNVDILIVKLTINSLKRLKKTKSLGYFYEEIMYQGKNPKLRVSSYFHIYG